MADDLENSREWRDTVETRLGKLEGRVEEQARLRAAMDKDISTLRVERNVLQALHDTQSDHTKRLVRLEAGQNELRSTIERVDVGVNAIRHLLEGDSGSSD